MVQNGQPLGQMVIKLGLETSAFSDSLTGATRAVKTSVREMGAEFRVLDSGGKKLDALSSKRQGLTKVIQAQTNELGYLKEAYEKTLDSEGNATSTTAKAAQKYNEAQAKLAGYQAQLAKTSGELARYKVETEGVTGMINRQSDTLIKVGDRLNKVGNGMQSIGSTATKYVTAPLALGMGMVTKAAIDWESAFAGVKKTNDEVIDSNGNVTYSYKDLENGLRGLAKELPSSHKEIAEVAEAAGQLGIQTPNVVEFTKTMIDMGESTNMSAEQAATTFARFANITQMSQKDFDRLGAVVVELGNNFATTETEISEMGLRLAGAGTQIGMSQAEIMGFATALSSVGIEAEAGGSAFSKVMVQMQLATEKGMGSFDELIALGEKTGVSFDQMVNAVNKGGKPLKEVAGQMGLTNKELRSMYNDADKSAIALQNFAEVAGMTNAEFANMFKQDPSKAIMKFVQGLANAESQGKSAIAVLDDMDIKEVRLRDSLLRAANASGVFEDAIKMGSKAWEENTALTDEANKRYETTAAKLSKLKNEAYDAAIDLGGPFVDALRSGLEASKPIIKNLGEMAKAFSEMDKEQQQNILKWGAFALALGPATKLLGNVISLTGTATKGLGLMGKGIVNLAAKSAEKKAIEGIGTSIAGVGTQATIAAGTSGTTGVGGFLTVLESINPYVLGAVGALAVGTAAWVAYDKTVGESKRRTEQWGSDIGKSASDSLSKYKEFSDQGQQAIRDLDSGTSTSAKNITETFNSMSEDIAKSGEKANKEIQTAINKLPQEMQKSVQESANKQIEANKKSVQIADESSKQIISIYEKHNGDISKFTDDEKQIVINNQRTLNAEKVRLMELSASEQKTVLAALNGDISDMTEKQREKAMTDLISFHTKQQSQFIDNKKNLAKALGEGTPEYEAELKKLEAINKASTDQMAINMIKLAQANGESSDMIRVRLGQLGIDYRDKARLIELANNDIKNSNDLVAESTNEMSVKTRDANKSWNSLIWDEKTASVKSNVQEEVTNSLKSADGWNQMKLILKNADLSSNAKEVIFNAIKETDKWKGLEIDKKLLKADNVQLIQSLIDSEGALNKYNELSPILKTLIADGPAKMTIEDTKKALNEYNSLPESFKTLLANNDDANNKFDLATVKLQTYNILHPEHKLLTGDSSNVQTAAQTGENSLNLFSWNNPLKKILTADSSNVQSAAQTGENSLNLFSWNNPAQKNLTGNSSNVINSAGAGELALNAFNQNNPAGKSLEAYDNASGNANTASDSIERFWRLPDVITKTVNAVGNWLGFEKGTNFHPGGMAMVNDQKGATYKELVTLPNGASFIPEGRNVFLPLPRGSKVMPARQTAMLPRYAGGVGVPSNASDVKSMTRISSNIRASEVQQSSGGELASLMQQMIFEIAKLQPIFSNNSETQANLLRELLNKDPVVKISRDSIARATNEVNARDQVGKYFS